MMQAIAVSAFKGLSHVKLDVVENPAPGPTQLLVEPAFAGVNPVDWKLAEGLGKGMLTPPYVMGCELSGRVLEVGASVKHWNPGDRIAAYCKLNRCGAFASHVIVELDECAHIPDAVSDEQAASLVIGGLTAWQALTAADVLQAGRSVLIHGASGGVGSLAVQFAKQSGATVFATASTRNADYLKSLGVDRFIDYTQTAFETCVRNVDAVLDAVGGDSQEQCFKVIKPEGRLISIVSPPSAKLAGRAQVHAEMVAVTPDAEQLRMLLETAAAGHLTARIDRTYTLADVPSALQRSKSGKSQGKLLIDFADVPTDA